MTLFGFGGTGSSQITQDEIDESTPFVAAGDGDLNLLKATLEHLNMPLSKPDENGFTICHAAAAYNHVHILQWIISEAGESVAAIVNAQDTDGDTPLHHCDKVEAAQTLIREGRANYTLKNNAGQTALQLKQDDFEEAVGGDDDDNMDDIFIDEIVELKELIDYLKEFSTTNPQ